MIASMCAPRGGWLVLIAVLAFARAVAAEDPITVEATYEEFADRGKTHRLVHVKGKTRYPDGTRFAIGIAQASNPGHYFAWYMVAVKEHAFRSEMGSWKKPMASGTYVVEARCALDRQPGGAVLEAVQKFERSAKFDKSRGPDGSVVGTCKIEVGTALDVAREKEESRAMYAGLRDDLAARLEEVRRAVADPKSAVPADALLKQVSEADVRAIDFRSVRTTIHHNKAARAISDAVIGLQDLIGGLGSMSAGAEAEFAKIRAALDEILRDIGPPPAPKDPEKGQDKK